MDDSGQTRLADGTTRIQFVPTYQQLTTIAGDFDQFLDDNERDLLEGDDDGEMGRLLHRLSRNSDQLRLIASKLEREPEPGVLAERIYGWLKDWLNPSGIQVPGFVHNAILDILTDQYRHLDTVQREEIRRMTAQIMAAGDGGDNTMDVGEARALMVRENWSIAQMLEWTQLEEDGLRQRLDFDPDTGNPWEDE